MNRLYFRQVSDIRALGTLTPDEDLATAQAAGTYAELDVDPDTRRWLVTISVARKVVFYAQAMATVESARDLANEAIARERAAEIAGLVMHPEADTPNAAPDATVTP